MSLLLPFVVAILKFWKFKTNPEVLASCRACNVFTCIHEWVTTSKHKNATTTRAARSRKERWLHHPETKATSPSSSATYLTIPSCTIWESYLGWEWYLIFATWGSSSRRDQTFGLMDERTRTTTRTERTLIVVLVAEQKIDPLSYQVSYHTIPYHSSRVFQPFFHVKRLVFIGRVRGINSSDDDNYLFSLDWDGWNNLFAESV